MERIEVSDIEYVRTEVRGSGVSEKFWVNHNGVLKLVKLSGTNQDLMELLSMRILKEVGLSCVDVELCYDKYSNKNGCLVTNFLDDEADVLYELLDWKTIRDKDSETEISLCFDQMFKRYANLYGISSYELENIKRDYVRIIFGKCLIENFDSKLSNIGLIFNERTKIYRLPPSFDNGCAFRSHGSITKPIVNVGNQIFDIDLVLKFIVENYLPYISDVIPNLELLDEERIIKLMSDLDLDIEIKKYIINYLLSFKENVIDMKDRRKQI